MAAVPYRPLPSHTGLGLTAFHIALLTTFCGFLGAVIVNMSVDGVLGYATTEVGPVWRQRRPVAISRWQTLLAKWVMGIGLTVILTGVMLGAAVVILKMNAPHCASLWLLSWFAATVVAIGTLVLFAALGTMGQIAALLVLVYLLASSGGTVPLDALSGFSRFLANFEPLRQILDGVRAILYFIARGAAGLTRAWIASGLGLVFWVILGILVTSWYDRNACTGCHRKLWHIDRAVLAYRNKTEQPIATSHAGLEPGLLSASQPQAASHPSTCYAMQPERPGTSPQPSPETEKRTPRFPSGGRPAESAISCRSAPSSTVRHGGMGQADPTHPPDRGK